MLRTRLLAATVIIALPLLIFGCGERDEEPSTESLVEYETAIVSRADITADLTTEGTVVAPPNKYAAIECSYCAPVSRVFATVGQSLRKGDVIVDLSHPDVRAATDAAEVELEQAQNALREARREYSADVAAAVARLEAARAVEREARSALQQAQGQTPPPDNIVQLQVAYESAHERRSLMEDLVEAAEERMREALTPFRHRVAAAEEDMDDARAEQKRFMIATPIDGQLIELNVGPGEQPGLLDGPMAVVADLSTLRVHGRLTESQAAEVRPGMPAIITLTADDDTLFEGEVERINTETPGPSSGEDRGRTYVAVIPFTNTQGEAKPEMDAEVTIKQGRVTDVLVVPVDAVQRDSDGHAFVNVQTGDTWDRRSVVTGLSDGELMEIRMGLDAGDLVRVAVEMARPVEM